MAKVLDGRIQLLLVRVAHNVGMFPFRKKETCIRCGSSRDVRVVTYVRPEQRDHKLSEPWCRLCRHQKLRGKRDVSG